MKEHLKLQDTLPIFERIRQQNSPLLKNKIVVLLCIGLAFLIGEAAMTICNLVLVLILKPLLREAFNGHILTLSCTTFMTLVVIFYCKVLERRPLRTMGFTKRKCLRDYLLGILIGAGMLSVALLIAWAGGTMEFTGYGEKWSVAFGIGIVLAWMQQGLSEEVICRSLLMPSFGAVSSPWGAVLVNALAFAMLHLGNANVTVLALCNLLLYGIFASLIFLRTDSVWMAAAMHSFWNFAQGNLYGISVSGSGLEDSMMYFSPKEAGTWLSGGAFGLEGGAAVTVVLVIACVIALLLPQRKESKQIPAPNPEDSKEN